MPLTIGLKPSELRKLPVEVQAMLRAVAALRDVWLQPQAPFTLNFVVEALKNLLASEPMQQHRDEALTALKHGLDPEEQNTLFNRLYPLPWKKS